MKKQRTNQQNKAIHLWFKLIADECQKDGITIDMIVGKNIELIATPYLLKEYYWRPIQKYLYGKKSTTQLTTKEIDKIYDVANKLIGENTGIHIPFPSIEQLYGTEP
jgi:hypothetical protein